MKFKNRKQQRNVCETMADLLIPLKYKLNDKNRECVEITLRILSETEVVEDGVVEDGNDTTNTGSN